MYPVTNMTFQVRHEPRPVYIYIYTYIYIYIYIFNFDMYMYIQSSHRERTYLPLVRGSECSLEVWPIQCSIFLEFWKVFQIENLVCMGYSIRIQFVDRHKLVILLQSHSPELPRPSKNCSMGRIIR